MLYISSYGLTQPIVETTVISGKQVDRRFNRPSILPEITGKEVLLGANAIRR